MRLKGLFAVNNSSEQTGETSALLAILLLAFVLRAGLAVFYPGIAHPDEIFQYQEPVHKLLTGLGVPSWEWNRHIRSWFIPGLVLPIMAAVRLFTHSPTVYWDAISCVLSAASLPVVWVAFRWGREQGGREGGIIAGFLAAVSFQLVYFSSHLLMDTVAADLLVPALYACREYRLKGGLRALAWGSALLGVLLYVRPQIGPILLVPAIATLLEAKRRGEALACLGWGLGPLLALGALDWITLGQPFRSVWMYAYINLFQVEDEFGVAPFYWYLKNSATVWMLAIVPIGYFSWKASRYFRLEWITALLIVVLMSAVSHKEPRFILPAQAVLLVLTGVGIGTFRLGRSGFWARPSSIGGIIAITSLGLALAHPFLPVIQRSHADVMVITRVMKDPQACGIYFSPRQSLLAYAGYTGTRDGVRLFSDRFDTPAANAKHANYIVTRLLPRQSVPIPARFALKFCKESTSNYQVCVYHRPGGCG